MEPHIKAEADVWERAWLEITERERVEVADWQIVPSEGDVCPQCGADLELLVDMESASVDGERCTEDAAHFDNLFCDGASWPTE